MIRRFNIFFFTINEFYTISHSSQNEHNTGHHQYQSNNFHIIVIIIIVVVIVIITFGHGNRNINGEETTSENGIANTPWTATVSGKAKQQQQKLYFHLVLKVSHNFSFIQREVN
jgi:Na+/H+ antiporter NhaC